MPSLLPLWVQRGQGCQWCRHVATEKFPVSNTVASFHPVFLSNIPIKSALQICQLRSALTSHQNSTSPFQAQKNLKNNTSDSWKPDRNYPVILGELRSQVWCIFLVNEEVDKLPKKEVHDPQFIQFWDRCLAASHEDFLWKEGSS